MCLIYVLFNLNLEIMKNVFIWYAIRMQIIIY